MKIIDYFTSENQEHWLYEIKKSDWSAGQYLYELLQKGELKTLCGAGTKVLLLIDGNQLVSFCTYAEQDEIREPSFMPWVGFAYTFPAYRGQRYMGLLLNEAYTQAREDRYSYLYISTGETGLYEKYGYTFWRMMQNIYGEDSRVYRIRVSGRESGLRSIADDASAGQLPDDR